MSSHSLDVEMLERERQRLEELLQADANWRMLQDLARERTIEQFAGTAEKSDLIRSLETVLSTNRYFLARRKIVEAIELLSGIGSAAGPGEQAGADGAIQPPPLPEVSASVSRVLRKGIAERMVMLAPQVASTTADPVDEPQPAPSLPLSSSRPAAARAVAWPGSDLERQAPARDRFELVRGMTAANIAALQDAGVSRFDAIAAWTATDVARMRVVIGDERLIARAGWIEQAAMLATGRDTAFARLIKSGSPVVLSEWPSTHEGDQSDQPALAALTPALEPANLEPSLDTLNFDAVEVADENSHMAPVIEVAEFRPEQVEQASADEPFLVLADHDAIRFNEPGELPDPPVVGPTPIESVSVQPPPSPPAATLQSVPAVIQTTHVVPAAPVIVDPLPPPPVQSVEIALTPPPAVSVPEQTMMQRLAQLERDLAELDQVGKPPVFGAAPAISMAQPPKPKPVRGARSTDRHIEDEEFPELSVREADVAIVPGSHAMPSKSTPTTQSMLRRQRQSEHLLEAENYAGYRTEIEEASVEIVRKSSTSSVAHNEPAPGPAGALPEVKASKASVQRFLKTLGNKP